VLKDLIVGECVNGKRAATGQLGRPAVSQSCIGSIDGCWLYYPSSSCSSLGSSIGVGGGVDAEMALELGSEKLLDVSFVFDGRLMDESGNGDWNRWG
jgi:hypothetical protein